MIAWISIVTAYAATSNPSRGSVVASLLTKTCMIAMLMLLVIMTNGSGAHFDMRQVSVPSLILEAALAGLWASACFRFAFERPVSEQFHLRKRIAYLLLTLGG